MESIGGGQRGRRARLTLNDVPCEIFDERVGEILQRRLAEDGEIEDRL